MFSHIYAKNQHINTPEMERGGGLFGEGSNSDGRAKLTATDSSHKRRTFIILNDSNLRNVVCSANATL